MFQFARVTEAVWPEITGVATGIGLQLAASSVDNALPVEQPVAQWSATGITFLGGAYLLGTGKAPDFAKGLLLGGLAMIGTNLARALYDRVTGAQTQQKAVDFAALVPRRVLNVKTVATGGLTSPRPSFPRGSSTPVGSQVAARGIH